MKKILISMLFVMLSSYTMHAKYGSQEQEFFDAVYADNVQDVQKMIGKKGGFFSKALDPKALNDNKETALFYINYKKPNALNIAQKLLDAGVDVNAQRYNGDTVLIFLADKYTDVMEEVPTAEEKKLYAKAINFYLGKGADRTIKNDEGRNFNSYLSNKELKACVK